MQELPLLIFTVLEQTAVGACITLLICQLIKKQLATKTVGKIAWVLFGVAVVALLASIFHLGQPGRMFNAIAGLGTSPLSMEVFIFGLFLVALALYAIFGTLDKGAVSKAFGIIASILGAVAVIVTCICYTLPGVPSWDSPLTAVQFILTVVVCGIPLALALIETFDKGKHVAIWWVVFIVLLITQLVMRWFFYSDITTLLAIVTGA